MEPHLCPACRQREQNDKEEKLKDCVSCSSLSLFAPICLKTIKFHVISIIFWTPFSSPSIHFGKNKSLINIHAIEKLLLFFSLRYCWLEKDKFNFVFVMLFLMVEESNNCNYGNNPMISFFFLLIFKYLPFSLLFIEI